MSEGPHPAKIRVFLADDHAVVREGLRLIVSGQPDMEVIGESADGLDACTKVESLKPDVVVMDVSMPRCNGIVATQTIRKSCTATRVLALTMREDMESLSSLIKAGASGYVLKRSASEGLAQAIRMVARGQVYIDPSLGSRIVSELLAKTGNPAAASERELSAREAQVLKLIAWGYSNKEISNRMSLSAKTVETYKTRLMQKLDFRSRNDIVRYALRQGWLEED
jgi:two-component system, NarL family, response regulator NreC